MKRAGFLLLELVLACFLAAFSLPFLISIITATSQMQYTKYTTLLKAHYDIAHALRIITPLKRVEQSSGTITMHGMCGNEISIAYAHTGCQLIRAGKTMHILPRTYKALLDLIKHSPTLMSLSITFSDQDNSLTLIHTLYIA